MKAVIFYNTLSASPLPIQSISLILMTYYAQRLPGRVLPTTTHILAQLGVADEILDEEGLFHPAAGVSRREVVPHPVIAISGQRSGQHEPVAIWGGGEHGVIRSVLSH